MAGIATDPAGSAYIIGKCGGHAVFGSISISNAAAFLAKVDNSGSFRWATPLISTVSLSPYGVAVDTNGNSYVTGSYSGSSPTFGTNLLDGGGFIAKFDGNGNLLWATPAGDGDAGVALDRAGNVLVVGGFFGTYAWGSGATRTNLTSQGNGANLSLARYDNDGNVVWVSSSDNFWSFTGAGTPVAISDDGSIFIAGMQSSANIGFIYKYSASGNLVWAHFVTNAPLSSVAVDSSNYVYAVGNDRLPGGLGSHYMEKLNSAGNSQWTNVCGSPGSYGWPSIAVTPPGKNIYLAGHS